MAQCLNPIYIKKKIAGIAESNTSLSQIPVPCGKCYECLARRASNWSVRLMQETREANTALFVTLTYNTQNVPLSEKGYMTLHKSECYKEIKKGKNKGKLQKHTNDHLTLFFKRLRIKVGKGLKYYAVGEYGSERMRPHYHAIIFNASYEAIMSEWRNPETGIPLGDYFFGTVTEASVGYVLKYLSKGKQIPKHKNDDRTPEYCRISKGIGLRYVKVMLKYHKQDPENRCFHTLADGKKAAMSRYYKEKIYNEYERKQIAAHMAQLDSEKPHVEPYLIHMDNLHKIRKMRHKAEQINKL